MRWRQAFHGGAGDSALGRRRTEAAIGGFGSPDGGGRARGPVLSGRCGHGGRLAHCAQGGSRNDATRKSTSRRIFRGRYLRLG